MKLNKFDENFEMYVEVSVSENPVALSISDSLYVIDELPNLPKDYEERIVKFLQNSSVWYAKAIDRMKSEAQGYFDCELLSVFILSEPKEENLIFGLEFGSSLDEEHNIGMKITEKDLTIIEYGGGDVAFC